MSQRQTWVLVAGGFHGKGGMDRCNWALARHLGRRGDRVHLVCHHADAGLRNEVTAIHLVSKPAGSFMLGGLLLNRRGQAVANRLAREAPGTRVVVNGGNCDWPDINWVHYVHAAWQQGGSAPAWLKAKSRFSRWLAVRGEQTVLPAARVVIANSERTRRDLIEHLGVDSKHAHTVYLGSEAGFCPAAREARAAARAALGQEADQPLIAFIGALGHDSRKGFDTLFSAWTKLCARPDWDARLIVAGGGRALEFWRRQIHAAGHSGRILVLGFTERVPELLAAADLLVSPARYEAYGLNVHEAICCGVPAMVSRRAGVAERFTAELQPLLIDDPEDAEALAAKILRWRVAVNYWREKIMPLSETLRSYTLEHMAKRIVTLCTGESDSRMRSALGH